MKKTLLFFALIFVAFSLTGQQNLRKSASSGIIKQNTAKSATIATPALRLANSLTENWLVTSVWENNTKTEFTYGTNSEVATTSVWNKNTIAWDLSTKTEYTYDVNGNTTLILNFSRNAGSWISTSKTEMAYDASGNEILYTYSMWNGVSFTGFSKVEYFYDAGNNPTSEISYSYNAGTTLWNRAGKTEYTYTAGKNTQDLSYTWDLTLPTPAWVLSAKSDYTYNGSGKLTLEVDWDMDNTLPIPDWVYATKTEIGYDGTGNMNISTFYDWDKTLPVPAWVASLKSDYVYDVNKNLTQYTLSMWDGAAWMGYTKSESTYSTNQSVTLSYNWNALTSLWDLKTRTTYNYTDITALEKPAENGIKIYPNPARDYIVIESDGGSGTATVQIFDLQGRKVADAKQSAERQIIPTAGMKKGLYLYRINAGGKVLTGKLMVE